MANNRSDSFNKGNYLLCTSYTFNKLTLPTCWAQFLSDQCKEIEENKEWERLEMSARKLEIPREHFMRRQTIKDRNGMDLTEAEDIKRWQKYTEKLYKKDLHNTDNHNGMITHVEPDILECESGP